MSDLAYDAIHALYAIRDSAWRNRIDGTQNEVVRLTHVAGELSDENIELRTKNSLLLTENERLMDRLDEARAASGSAGMRQRIRNLTQQLEREVRKITALERELFSVQRQLRGATALLGMTGGSRGSLTDDLPEGLTVKKLIKLVHPDRHNGGANEAIAHEAFKWLQTKR